MNLRIIHSSFQLNLVDTSFTMLEENNWFNEQLFTKYTYPISRKLNDEEDAAFQFISEYAARNVKTIFNVMFYVLDVEHEAVMEIDKIVGRRIEFQVRYGFEEFPNFEKQLAQLPLHKFELVGQTIYEHASTKIALAYPATDYNFPQIFTDKFDTETPQWAAFEGRINNYTGTVWVLNEYDEIEDAQLNRNVMQPLPSLLYVLKTGFADKGYTLAGDILEDPEFKNAFLYSLSDYYSTLKETGKQEFLVNYDDNDGPNPDHNRFYDFDQSITIVEAGRYKLAGNLFLNNPDGLLWFQRIASAVIHLNGVLIGSWENREEYEKFFLVDINFVVPAGTSNATLRFRALAANYREIGETRVYDAPFLDTTVSQLAKYNPDGSVQPTLVLPTDIDLTKCVPDATFGDLYKAIKQWKNYGIDIKENIVTMNLVKNLMGKGPVKDLSHREVLEPERTFNQGKTFELKFTEVQTEDYDFPSLYIDNTGSTQMPYVKKEDTQEITIDAIPLPLKVESGWETAHGFLDDKQKIQLVLYTGLKGGDNLCQDASALLMPNIYESHYKEWIDFLLKTISYLWTFNDHDLNVRDLRDKTTVFAYGIYHVVVKLSKRNLGGDDILETEIETYSLE